MASPYIWSPLPRARARVKKSAELSSARINNVLLCLEFSQSVLLTHLGKTYWFYSLWQIQKLWLSSQIVWGLGHEAFFARTWMAAAFSPSSKAMRPASDVETAGEPKKRHKKWKSGHKDKIAFSGQTKGDRRILRLISDHLVPAWVEPLWSPSHRTTMEQASETRRDTAADTLLLFLSKSHPQ